MAKSRDILSGLTVEVHEFKFEKALRLFTKKVNNSGKLREVKEREAFEKPSVKKRKAKKSAKNRWAKHLRDTSLK